MSDNYRIIKENNAIIFKVNAEQLQIEKLKDLSASIHSSLEEKPRKFILDLRGIHYLDSAALGMIFKVKDAIDSFSGNFFVTGVNRTISMVLNITKADRIIRILDSVDEALKIKVD